MMTLVEAIYQHSLNLPEPAAREALDFIQFLEQKHGVTSKVPVHAREEKHAAALANLARIRLHFDGKPIPDREDLYDGARS